MDQIAKNQMSRPRPKIAETVIDPTVRLRDVAVGKCCEILGDTAIEYSEIGDYSYLGSGCLVSGDAKIGKFLAR